MVTINEAIDRLKEASIEEPEVMFAPTEAQINNAEKELSLTLPPSYKFFLQNAGMYSLPFWEVFWVGDESIGYRNIIQANKDERENTECPLPEFLITFHNNGMGDQICFDIRSKDESGEYPIVFWDHEMSPQENLDELGIISNNFTEWLYQECIEELEG